MLTLERYPTADLLRLLANILTHIAQSNDSNPPVPIAPPSSSPSFTLSSAARTVLVSPTPTTTNLPLTFHARNVPTISLESYLLRILKYCPTSNFVFLSLLVYFDRMAAISLASGPGPAPANSGRRVFHIDSYNVHRLVIAGVTVASKFFSDVFYTNSRYAKVGGLPLPELNQLELQFLLLNDFRLVISPQQMLIYSQHLITFSLQHPPPSMGRLEISVLASTLGFNSPTSLPSPSPSPPSPPSPPPPVVVVLPMITTTTSTTSSSSSSPLLPSSPPLRPSSAPSPSPSNSSSSSLRSSPSTSPRPPRMIITNGHLARNRVRHQDPSDSDDSDQDDEDEDEDEEGGDAEETETLTSNSTDDDSEPTIRGPRTVVGWDGEMGRKSP